MFKSSARWDSINNPKPVLFFFSRFSFQTQTRISRPQYMAVITLIAYYSGPEKVPGMNGMGLGSEAEGPKLPDPQT